MHEVDQVVRSFHVNFLFWRRWCHSWKPQPWIQCFDVSYEVLACLAVDVVAGRVSRIELIVLHVKLHCELYFGVWSWLGASLPHVGIGLDARGFLYFEASARRSAHAPPFTIKLLQLALLQSSGCHLIAGRTRKSSQLCFLRSKFYIAKLCCRCFQPWFNLSSFANLMGWGRALNVVLQFKRKTSGVNHGSSSLTGSEIMTFSVIISSAVSASHSRVAVDAAARGRDECKTTTQLDATTQA